MTDHRYMKDEILALVLAGGAGRRFGGADKGLQEYKGRPLIEHVTQALGSQVDAIVISANRNIETYQTFQHPVIEDSANKAEAFEYQGPIAGIVAAFEYFDGKTEYTANQYLLISPCDTPDLPGDYAEKLLAALLRNNCEVAVVHDGARTQNLHCLLKREVLCSLRDFYNGGGRALHRWYATQEVIEVDFSAQAECFKNLNTQQQISA